MNTQQRLDSPDRMPSYIVSLLGRRVTPMTTTAVIDVINLACTENRKMTIASYNIHSFNLSMQLPWFYEFLQSADIARCDGVGILKALKYMGLDLPLDYQVAGTRFVPTLLEHFKDQKLSFFLLGSKPQNLEVALSRLRDRYPNLNFAGHHGYFDKSDPIANAKVIDHINSVRPNILLIGMGMPVQEKWIFQHSRQLNVNVILPCGAVIDRLAGIVPDCPSYMSKAGLEWFYRFAREPKRLAARYLLGNPAFALQLALGRYLQPNLVVEKVNHLSILNRKEIANGETLPLAASLSDAGSMSPA